jgi:pre-mRNA-splicing factor CWC22
MIEKLYEIRKAKFAEFPGVIPELDLIEETDKITHNVSIDDDLKVDEECNFFKLDAEFEQNETQWDEIKKEILGEYFSSKMGAGQNPDGSSSSSSDEEEAGIQINTATEIVDLTEQDMVDLRKTIYLVMVSSVDFEEACHKLLKIKIRPG